MKMSQHLSKNDPFGKADCEDSLHRKNTFSNFVDKVVDNFPVKVSSKNDTSIDPNNPFEVLENKGLLNISRSNMRTGDGSSDVKLSFFSEESKCGETKKIFSSIHHFKRGHLVYSSTHEILPHLHREFGTPFNECREMTGRRTLSAGEVQCKSESKSRRSKLTDLSDDAEEQKVRRFKREATERDFHSRSVSPVNLCDTTDENAERYLKSLRSDILKKQAAPFTISRSKKESPKEYRYYAACTYTPSTWHPEVSSYIKSSSELPICSRESGTCSSPRTIIEKTSQSECQYKRSTTSSRSKFDRDLFVTPAHTCSNTQSQTGRCRHLKTSHSDTHCKCATSPCFHCTAHQGVPSMLTEQENIRNDDLVTRESEIPCKGYQHRMKSTNVHSRVKSERCDKGSFNDNRDESRDQSPLKSILSQKGGQSSSNYSQRKIRFSDNQERKEKKSAEISKGHLYLGKKPISDSNGCKHGKNTGCEHKLLNSKQGNLEYTPARELATSESETDSELSSSPTRDSQKKRGTMEQHYSSSDSETSICSVRCEHQEIVSRCPSKKTFKKSCQQTRENNKHYHTEYKVDTYEHSETSTNRDKEKSLKSRQEIKRYRRLHGVPVESLDSYLRRTMHEKHNRDCMEIMQNIVNKKALEDYRQKYVNERNYDEHSECEACMMEQFWADKK